MMQVRVGVLSVTGVLEMAVVTSARYEIRVTGKLPPEALADYERLAADVEPAVTVLRGPLADISNQLDRSRCGTRAGDLCRHHPVGGMAGAAGWLSVVPNVRQGGTAMSSTHEQAPGPRAPTSRCVATVSLTQTTARA